MKLYTIELRIEIANLNQKIGLPFAMDFEHDSLEKTLIKRVFQKMEGIKMMKRLLTFTTLISLVLSQGLNAAYWVKPSVYLRIARAYIDPADLDSKNKPTSFKEAIHPSMTDAYKQATTLGLFASVDTSEEELVDDKKFIEPQAWQDLELLPSVFNAVDRTATLFGKAELAKMLVDEKAVSSIQELERRQQVVKKLVENEVLFNELDTVINNFKKSEESFLIFFLSQNSERQNLLKPFYYNKSDTESMPPFAAKPIADTIDGLNASPTGLLVRNVAENFEVLYSLLAIGATAEGLYHTGKDVHNRATHRPTQGCLTKEEADRLDAEANRGLLIRGGIIVLLVLVGAWKAFKNLHKVNETFQKIVELPRRPFRIFGDFKAKSEITTALQQDLMDLAQACEGMKGTSQFLSQQMNVKEMMPECEALFTMFENPESNSDDLNKLLNLLKENTFKGDPSVLSHAGNIYAANTLMNLTKDEWVKVFKAVGQLDVYLSIAKLVKEFENKRVHYSFATFVQADKPVLMLKDFWNPLISPDTVATNDISLGNGGPRTIIITGPNSGGKSVVLKSVAVAAILAQKFGIAPASQAVLTPFSTISTQINVSDAIPSGLSRFRAEVAQVKALSTKLNQQKPHEFNLVICDELFSSTSEDQAEQLVYEYAKEFAKSNNLCMQATHHPRLIVKLEEEVKEDGKQVFANYKVDIQELPDGKLQRNYKLEPGVSTQKFAQKILDEFGALPNRKS